MTVQTFSLIPFPDSHVPAVQITGQVSRQNGGMNIQYVITGATDKVRLPERSNSPKRKDGLWAATCFEFFLAYPGDPQYWEFNLSPSGDWNIYHMDAYRQVGFREERSIQWVQLEVRHEARRVLLIADVDLNTLIADSQPLELGISCVIQGIDRSETYWALAHPHPEPDFHTRDSFIVKL